MILPLGSVAERLNAPVLKTGVGKPIVSSNLTGPAKQNKSKRLSRRFFVGFKLFSALRLASMRNALASDAVAALLGECAGIFLLHSKQFSRRG
jgi:hypothetical protein